MPRVVVSVLRLLRLLRLLLPLPLSLLAPRVYTPRAYQLLLPLDCDYYRKTVCRPIYPAKFVDRPIYPETFVGRPINPDEVFGRLIYPEEAVGRRVYPEQVIDRSIYPEMIGGRPIYPGNFLLCVCVSSGDPRRPVACHLEVFWGHVKSSFSHLNLLWARHEHSMDSRRHSQQRLWH